MEVFQSLPKRALKFVKFISVWKGKKNLLELFLHEERIASCSVLGNFRLWVSNTYKHTFMVFNCRVWVGTTSEEYLNIPIGYLNNTGLRFCLWFICVCIFTA